MQLPVMAIHKETNDKHWRADSLMTEEVMLVVTGVRGTSVGISFNLNLFFELLLPFTNFISFSTTMDLLFALPPELLPVTTNPATGMKIQVQPLTHFL